MPPSAARPSSSRRQAIAIAGVLAVVAGIAAVRVIGKPDAVPSSAGEDAESAASVVSAPSPEVGSVPRASASANADEGRAPAEHAPTSLAWGSGPGQIGRPPAKEGHGETPLRLDVDAEGTAYLLDGENGRIVRLFPDGGAAGDIRLPVRDPLDLAVAKDGSLALLEGGEDREGGVTLTSPDGRARGQLPLPDEVARTARSVVVRGDDVYVESRSGEHRRVGDTSGEPDPNLPLSPGSPTRDGRAFVTAILPSPDATDVHVFVVERATGLQRWSRLVRPALDVEGIVLADTDAKGDVYLIVTGRPRDGSADDALEAQLMCLEAERGDVVGNLPLPVSLGPESIADAKALDDGGVVFTVTSSSGLRVERHDCPGS